MLENPPFTNKNEPAIFNFDSSEILVENGRTTSESLVEKGRISSESFFENNDLACQNYADDNGLASGRHCKRPTPPPRPPRRPKRNANSQTDTKTNGLSTQHLPTCDKSPSATPPSSTSSNNTDQPLQLTVSMAPVSSSRHHPSHGTSHGNRHCKHCTMSQHNFQAPERIDKASNTEKSCGNKHL